MPEVKLLKALSFYSYDSIQFGVSPSKYGSPHHFSNYERDEIFRKYGQFVKNSLSNFKFL